LLTRLLEFELNAGDEETALYSPLDPEARLPHRRE
jgi:hypothetical protein